MLGEVYDVSALNAGLDRIQALTGASVAGNTSPLGQSFSISGMHDGQRANVSFNIELPEFKVGTVPLHGIASTMQFNGPPGFAFASGGVVTLDSVAEPGAPLSGSFSGNLAFLGAGGLF